jgi:hypothetical protein
MKFRLVTSILVMACLPTYAATYGIDKSLVYRYEDNGLFKPYVQQLFSPGGVNVVRDNVPDHVHHHGLMFAVAVDGVDFRAEAPANGHEVGVAFKEGNPFGQKLEWRKPDSGDVLAREQRVIAASCSGEPKATELTWRSTLEAPKGRAKIALTGSHYFGLGMRFPESMDNSAVFSNAEDVQGEIVRGDERNFEAAWCACTGTVEGKPVTIAMFNHPTNARPATWFTMAKPFAYMSATLNLHKEAMTVDAAKPLHLCYGVAVWDGTVSRNVVAAQYGEWLKRTN